MPYERPRSSTPDLKRRINISESVEVSMEGLEILGLTDGVDTSELSEKLRLRYAQLIHGQNRPGELYLQIPIIEFGLGFQTMLDRCDDRAYGKKRYSKSNLSKDLWVPGENTGSFTEAAISNTGIIVANPHDLSSYARLALNDGQNPKDEFLQFTNQPIDGFKLKESKTVTQLESFMFTKAAFEDNNPGFNMTDVNAPGFEYLSLQRRIRGERMPVTNGFLQMLTLGRTAIRGASTIGVVYSLAGQTRFEKSTGEKSWGKGIGLSVGLNDSLRS